MVVASNDVETPGTSAEMRDFEAFYAATFDSLCVQLYAHTGDLADAQDVVQEAFCRALSRWKTLSRYDDPQAWVRKVAWNLATSRWRRMKTAITFARGQQEHSVDEPDPTWLDLTGALAKLPSRQRQAIVLHYIADLPIQEIAAITGVAVGTVKSWLHRGRAALDALMEVRDV
jgi:RNA polymerase sigma-70 factor (ECF subfamily)